MDIKIAKEREEMSIFNVLFQTETETETTKKLLKNKFKNICENQRTDFPIYFIYFHWIEIKKCRKVDHYVSELIDDYSRELSCIIVPKLLMQTSTPALFLRVKRKTSSLSSRYD
jgi:hypothetical protein